MKLMPKALRTLAIAALLAAPMITFTAGPSGADEPIEVDGPAAYEAPNQVLEIPQSCTLDGAPVACDESNSSPGAEGSNMASGADPNAASPDALAKANGDYADQSAGQEWGTAQEYENQPAGGPMVSAAVPYASGVMPGAVYYGRPMVVMRPIPMAPYAAAGNNFPPRMMAAPGPIGGARPAWMFAPSAMRPMTMSRPMMPMGMPGMLRLH
jgi:hypothetical protein